MRVLGARCGPHSSVNHKPDSQGFFFPGPSTVSYTLSRPSSIVCVMNLYYSLRICFMFLNEPLPDQTLPQGTGQEVMSGFTHDQEMEIIVRI